MTMLSEIYYPHSIVTDTITTCLWGIYHKVGVSPFLAFFCTTSKCVKAAGIRDYLELEIDGPQGLCNHYSSLSAKFKVANIPVGGCASSSYAQCH